MLHIYKPIGITCGELITQLRNKHNYTKIAFCGRLDPMAHGEMLCIHGDETKNTKQHLEHNKTYEFRFVIGLSTDTTDTMGLFNNEDYLDDIDINVLLEYINNIKTNTSFPQKYHKFSSFTPPTADAIHNNISNSNETSDKIAEQTDSKDSLLSGSGSKDIKMKKMPLWYWSSKGIQTKDYYKDVIIYNLEIISVTDVMRNEIISEAITNIQKVTNQKEFRIPLILQQYDQINKQEKSKENKSSNNTLNFAKPHNMKELRIRVKVSTGFYVRQFVQDLSDKFKVKMMVTEIFRLEIY
jgi:hypothetical protein